MNIKDALAQMYSSALKLNDRLVAEAAAQYGPFPTLLDVGCWDGENTLPVAKAAQATTIIGIEVVPEAAAKANAKGIKTVAIAADQDRWPFEDNSIDCITSNQVIEHLTNVDHFLAEASRVLRPGGVMITSTNNLSSWHNIWALVFGWTPFDLTNSSIVQQGIGNPLALHKGQSYGRGSSWTHKCIYTARQLFDWQALYGLKKERLYTAGYYPLPARVGSLLQTHAAFIVTTTRKNLAPIS